MRKQFIYHTMGECLSVDFLDLSEMNEREQKAAEKICKASTDDEIADIISDELVHSIMEQINEK